MADVKQLLRRSRDLFNVDYIDDTVNRRNRHAWVRAVLRLGNKWLLAQPIERTRNAT